MWSAKSTPLARDVRLCSSRGSSIQAERITVGVLARAAMYVPIETARKERAMAERLGADCVVAIGAALPPDLGLGKAIALVSGLPILAAPTTYAGSEMTPIYGTTESVLKKTGKDDKVLQHGRWL